jgi:nucleoside-diphosphate-sugar epimerase
MSNAKNDTHVVLGASGAIGQAVIAALQTKNVAIRAVGRTKQIEGVETIHADLLNETQTMAAIKGASHVYLCVGLPYSSKAWKRDWPRLMESVIKACGINKAKLIFFDNVYMYGAPLPNPFREDSPQSPKTKKGLVRKQIADALMKAHHAGRVEALIGRSADFYGPHATNSPLYTKFLEQINKGKNPQILSRPDVKRTYAYTLDNGRALVQLALDDGAYGDVWHLPVSRPITFDEVIAIFNKILGSNYKTSYLPRPLTNMVSLVVNPVKEMREMLYQFDEPYIMADQKFREKYSEWTTTSYEVGLRAMIESFNTK